MVLLGDRDNSDHEPSGNTKETIQENSVNKVEYLSGASVLAPVLSYDNNSIWYFNEFGQLYRQELDGDRMVQEYPLPERKNIKFVLWPSEGAYFILGTPEARFNYDPLSNQFIQYPPEVKFVDWMPSGQRVLYVWSDNKEITLSRAYFDLSDHDVLAKLPHSGLRAVSSPNGKSFILYSSSGQDPIYRVIEGLGVLESISDPAPVLSAEFSPDGQLLAYIESDNGMNYVRTIEFSSKITTVRGIAAEGSDLLWSKDGRHLYWLDQKDHLIDFDVNSELINDIFVEFKSDVPRVEEIVVGRNEKEFFFLEKETRKLGRILLQ